MPLELPNLYTAVLSISAASPVGFVVLARHHDDGTYQSHLTDDSGRLYGMVGQRSDGNAQYVLGALGALGVLPDTAES